MSAFDFDAAVHAPFRMQPGLRRLAPGTPQLTPLTPGSRHQREKLAVLSAYAGDALLAKPGFDAQPALDALCQHAAAEQPDAWQWDGRQARALKLGTAVNNAGEVERYAEGVFGLGDEVSRCLLGLRAPWRLAGLLSLAFAQDFAIVDGPSASLPWLAVCLPSHWAPRDKVGRSFVQAHAPVADNALLLKAAPSIVDLVTGTEAWERFVWMVTSHPRLHAHPDHVDADAWSGMPVEDAWWRTEHQSFVPVPGLRQAVFLIHVQVQPLASALTTASQCRRLHAAVASMTPAVLAYRHLMDVREPLLAWLSERAEALAARGPA
jgi:dimethylamine monooxygenase subunit A